MEEVPQYFLLVLLVIVLLNSASSFPVPTRTGNVRMRSRRTRACRLGGNGCLRHGGRGAGLDVTGLDIAGLVSELDNPRKGCIIRRRNIFDRGDRRGVPCSVRVHLRIRFRWVDIRRNGRRRRRCTIPRHIFRTCLIQGSLLGVLFAGSHERRASRPWNLIEVVRSRYRLLIFGRRSSARVGSHVGKTLRVLLADRRALD